MRTTPSGDITRIVLIVLLICLLLLGSFWTRLPFLGALGWATTIVVATWPAMKQVERMTGGRRGVAVAIMTLLILAALIVPLTFAISTLVDAAWRQPGSQPFPSLAGRPPNGGSRLPQAGRTRGWRRCDPMRAMRPAGPSR